MYSSIIMQVVRRVQFKVHHGNSLSTVRRRKILAECSFVSGQTAAHFDIEAPLGARGRPAMAVPACSPCPRQKPSPNIKPVWPA
jgi:hypothetical protein